MAKIYPPIPNENSDEYELEVRNHLSKLPDSWQILHRQRVISGKKEKEIDFILVNPEKGWICLEVKGGAISRDESGWKQSEKRIDDPVKKKKKARSLMYDLLEKKGHPITKFWGWNLVFPSIGSTNINLGSDLPKEKIIFSDQLPYMEEIFDSQLKTYGKSLTLNQDSINSFLNIVAPEFNLYPTLQDTINREEQIFVSLTKEQHEAIDQLEGQRKVLISGRAGTGKTILALEFARRKLEENKDVLYLCYNRPLTEEIELKTSASNIDVFNFHGLCRYFITKTGGSWNEPKDGDKDNFWNVETANLLSDALTKDEEKRWDVILVDEAQDFRKEWWISIMDCLRHPSESYCWAFTDPKQNVYQLDQHLGEFDLRPFHLLKNCRNTEKIAKAAYDYVGETPNMFIHSPEGEDVKIKSFKNEKDQILEINDIVSKLLEKEKVNINSITILTTKSTKKSILWSQRYKLNFNISTKRGEKDKIFFSSIKRFKGLDSDIVILMDVNDSISELDLYTGTSRAKHKLFLLKTS